MMESTPEQDKATVLEAFDTLFNKRDSAGGVLECFSRRKKEVQMTNGAVALLRKRWVSFPKILSSADSRDEAESAHHPARCLPSSICLGHLSPTYSSRNAGLKSRISFSAISSKLL